MCVPRLEPGNEVHWSLGARGLEHQDTTCVFTGNQVVEGFLRVVDRVGLGDQFVEFQVAGLVEFEHSGKVDALSR